MTATSHNSPPLATPLSRAIAFLVDGAISQWPLGIAVLALPSTDPVIVVVGTQVLTASYFVGFWSASGGSTLGMKMAGIRLSTPDGRTPGALRSLVRYVVLMVGMAVLLLGLVGILIDSQRQGWHDKVARTLVVRGRGT